MNKITVSLIIVVGAMGSLTACSTQNGGHVGDSGLINTNLIDGMSWEEAFERMRSVSNGIALASGLDGWYDNKPVAQASCGHGNAAVITRGDGWTKGAEDPEAVADAVDEYLRSEGFTTERFTDTANEFTVFGILANDPKGVSLNFGTTEAGTSFGISSSCAEGPFDPTWRGALF